MVKRLVIILFTVFCLQNTIIRSGEIMHKYTNHLVKEKSPYLQQHAHNPVDWYPWGKAAFEKAKKEDKPIFLSIGYATCHWCHVMERESFENEDVAKLMNKVFVNIKVDREEHPDIDTVYMKVCMMLIENGGWPLTIIMTPDQKPFYAATYIPRESRFGRMGMLELVPRIEQVWKSNRAQLEHSAEEIAKALQNDSTKSVSSDLAMNSLAQKAYQALAAAFDPVNGSFGGAPKFPSPPKMSFLLRYWRRTGDEKALRMVEFTLRKIRHGGIYDHIGFGVHRYATDAAWLLPHFEKMLYNQAMLAETYVEAYQATRSKEYKTVAREIYTYVLRDMTSPDGVFYAAEDADSEGEEGKFYVWSFAELEQLLDKREITLVEQVYNVKATGNFHDESTRELTGKNIPHLNRPLDQIAAELKIGLPELRHQLEQIREKLFKAREKRIHPLKDTKVLTDWNGMMIGSLAYAARVFDSTEYLHSAERAADFILKHLVDRQGRLYHRWMDGEAAIDGKLEDYAQMIQGLLALYETSFKVKYLDAALGLNSVVIKHFADNKHGGFFMTPDFGHKLLVRPQTIYGGAIPSGNAVMVMNLIKLGRLTGNPEYEQRADGIIRAYGSMIAGNPAEFAELMNAMLFIEGPAYEIVISGNQENDETQKVIQTINQLYLPEKVVVLRPEHDYQEIVKIAPYVGSQIMIDGKTTVYICRNTACEKPLVGIGNLKNHPLFK